MWWLVRGTRTQRRGHGHETRRSWRKPKCLCKHSTHSNGNLQNRPSRNAQASVLRATTKASIIQAGHDSDLGACFIRTPAMTSRRSVVPIGERCIEHDGGLPQVRLIFISSHRHSENGQPRHRQHKQHPIDGIHMIIERGIYSPHGPYGTPDVKQQRTAASQHSREPKPLAMHKKAVFPRIQAPCTSSKQP